MSDSIDRLYVEIEKARGLLSGGSSATAKKLRGAQAKGMRAYAKPLKRGRFFGDDKAGRLADRAANAADYLERRAEGRMPYKGFRGKRTGSYK